MSEIITITISQNDERLINCFCKGTMWPESNPLKISDIYKMLYNRYIRRIISVNSFLWSDSYAYLDGDFKHDLYDFTRTGINFYGWDKHIKRGKFRICPFERRLGLVQPLNYHIFYSNNTCVEKPGWINLCCPFYIMYEDKDHHYGIDFEIFYPVTRLVDVCEYQDYQHYKKVLKTIEMMTI